MADIIFLLDATESMCSCLNDIKENVFGFLESLKTPETHEGVALRDWRATVYGYRDFEADGTDNWFVTNPFTRSPEEVRSQLAALVATGGGGDESHDLLDALDKIATIGESAKGDPEDSRKWRYHTQAARCVVVFTDATFHGCSDDGMEFVRRLASDSSKTGWDVVNDILQNRIWITIFAPDFCSRGWNGYAMLDNVVDKLEHVPIPIGSDNDPQRAFAEFIGDSDGFKRELFSGVFNYLTRPAPS